MNEVRKCSLSGVAFTMDADAFALLAEYIETLKKNYEDSADGDEIVADIEARIAELILSAQDSTRVVERPLVENIIRQMGSAEDISETDPAANRRGGPRIPRRLYRDTQNAKLGGVCAGIGKYFDVDPVWVRLTIFLPLLVLCLQWIPVFRWIGPMMGNLFGIFIICYLIMWFAVPTARTARQKLEMNGERITEQAIRRTTEQTAAQDPDSRTKPVVAEAVSAVGKVVLMLCKLFAGLIVFGLILGACALIIALFAIIVGGHDMPLSPHFLEDMNLGIPILGILLVLIPIILLIYVLMCLIASRKPGSKTLLAIFLTWIAGLAMLVGLAYKENAVDRVRQEYKPLGRVLNQELIIDSDTTTLGAVLREFDDEKIVEDDLRSLHISIPSKGIEIVVDKETSQMEVTADGKRITMQASDDERTGIRIGKRQTQEL